MMWDALRIFLLLYKAPFFFNWYLRCILLALYNELGDIRKFNILRMYNINDIKIRLADVLNTVELPTVSQ